MNDFKKYYLESWAGEPGMTEFEKLTPKQEQLLKDSTDFARWKARRHLRQVADAFFGVFGLERKK